MGEKAGFKGKVFGGFDRKGVIEYIEKMSSELNEYKSRCEKLEQDNLKLAEENDVLRVANDELAAQNDELQSEIQVCKDEAEQQQGALASIKDKLASYEVNASIRAAMIEKQARDRAFEFRTRAEETVEGVRTEYDVIVGDLKNKISGMDVNLTYFRRSLEKLTEAMDNGRAKLGDIDKIMEYTEVENRE